MINGKEILKDSDRYYIIRRWIVEKYNGVEHKVPIIESEITDEDIIELRRKERESKLKRILYTTE